MVKVLTAEERAEAQKRANERQNEEGRELDRFDARTLVGESSIPDDDPAPNRFSIVRPSPCYFSKLARRTLHLRPCGLETQRPRWGALMVHTTSATTPIAIDD